MSSHSVRPSAFADGAPPASAAGPSEVDRPDGSWKASAWADGIPDATVTARDPRRDPADLTPTEGPLATAVAAVTRIRSLEGLRGWSLRASILARHFTYFLTIVGCVAVSHWSFAAIPAWTLGGLIMLYSLTLMLVTAAVGTVLYADQRRMILDQWRHFALGIVAMPGAALALFMRLVSSALDTASAQQDIFASILTGNGLPLVYATLVTLPAAVYVKMVFGGMRTANRAAATDEEQLATWLRQDGLQR